MAHFVEKMQELSDCCNESVRTLAALPDEPQLRQRVAERRMLADELAVLTDELAGRGAHRRWRVTDACARAWRSASRFVQRTWRGPLDVAEQLEQALLRCYVGACDAGPPMSVGNVLLRHHDALKRAEFHRRSQPGTLRQPAEAGPRRSWPPFDVASLGRSLGAPTIR